MWVDLKKRRKKIKVELFIEYLIWCGVDPYSDEIGENRADLKKIDRRDVRGETNSSNR